MEKFNTRLSNPRLALLIGRSWGADFAAEFREVRRQSDHNDITVIQYDELAGTLRRKVTAKTPHRIDGKEVIRNSGGR